jgi:hypothetical protein
VSIYAFCAWNLIVFMGLEGMWQGGAILLAFFLPFSGLLVWMIVRQEAVIICKRLGE